MITLRNKPPRQQTDRFDMTYSVRMSISIQKLASWNSDPKTVLATALYEERPLES